MIPSEHEIANIVLERQLHDARNGLRMRLLLTKKELETIVAAIDKALKP